MLEKCDLDKIIRIKLVLTENAYISTSEKLVV